MKILRKDIGVRAFWILLAAVTAFRLLFTAFQRATLLPDTSMFDDYLVYEAARNITEGRWLGAYSYLTIGKHMLFPVWLALLHAFRIPYLFAGQALFTLASLVLVFAFSPVIKNRLHLLVFYLFLVFTPVSYADFTLRIYRDNISVSVSLLFFAGIIGFALRSLGETCSLWGYAAAAGFSLGAAFLLREDGVWLLPFAVAGTAVVLIRILREKPPAMARRLISMSLLAVLPLLSVAGFSAVNAAYYGRFVVSDLTSKEFYEACGAITRIRLPEESVNPIAPMPQALRQKLYEISPAFRELQPYLESGEFRKMRKDVGGYQDFSGGGYYWAVRWAASLAGHYETPDTAKTYYIRLADEINAACDGGVVESYERRSGLNAPITPARVAPTLKEAWRELLSVIFYRGIGCSPSPSDGSEQKIAEMENYLNTDAFTLNRVYGSDSSITLSACSPLGPVSVSVEDESGERLPLDVKQAAGGDFYLRRLLSTGDDFLYSDLLRRQVSFAGDSNGKTLILTAGGEELRVAAEMTGLVTAGSISYQIEYVGKDYAEISEADYSFAEIWSYRAMRVMVWLYRLVTPVILAAGLAAFALSAVRMARRRREKAAIRENTSLQLWISAGLALSALLRLAMIAFVEVSAFGIGTYPMYFSIAFPLLIAAAFSSLFTFGLVF